MIVPPRSKQNIIDNAQAVRAFLHLDNQHYFPVAPVYEILHVLCEGAHFEVHDDFDMGNDHGRTYPDKRLICLRNDVYERACKGEPRDRFTLCHELGHLLMHRDISLSRIDPSSPPKIYCNSEWQADTFASHLLMPRCLLANYSTIHEASEAFGVSLDAAYARRDELNLM